MSREGQGSLGKGENYRRRFFLIFAHGKGLGWKKTFPLSPGTGKGSRPKAQAQKRLLFHQKRMVLATAWPRNTGAGLTPQCCPQVGLA